MSNKYSLNNDKNYVVAKTHLELSRYEYMKEEKEEEEKEERMAKEKEAFLNKADKQLEKAKDSAVERLMKEVRKDHEKAVLEVVNALQQLAKVCEKEQEIRVNAIQALGPTSCIFQGFFDVLNPGSEDTYGTRLHSLISELRKNGYPV